MCLPIRVLLQTGQNRCSTAYRTCSPHGALQAASVVVICTALLWYEDARNDRSRAEIGPRARLIQGALLLLDLLKAGTTPLPVRVAHLIGEIRIVRIHCVYNA